MNNVTFCWRASVRKLDDLLHIEASNRDVVDRHQIVPRHDTRSIGWRSRQSLQKGHAAWADAYHASEPLLLGLLHLLQLVELHRVEKLGVRVELPQHGGNCALVDQFVGRRSIGRFLMITTASARTNS